MLTKLQGQYFTSMYFTCCPTKNSWDLNNRIINSWKKWSTAASNNLWLCSVRAIFQVYKIKMNQHTPLLRDSPNKEYISCNGTLPNNNKKKSAFRYAFWSLIKDVNGIKKDNSEQSFGEHFAEVGKLFKRTKRTNDIALIFASIGFILMLIDKFLNWNMPFWCVSQWYNNKWNRCALLHVFLEINLIHIWRWYS